MAIFFSKLFFVIFYICLWVLIIKFRKNIKSWTWNFYWAEKYLWNGWTYLVFMLFWLFLIFYWVIYPFWWLEFLFWLKPKTQISTETNTIEKFQTIEDNKNTDNNTNSQHQDSTK